MSRASKEFDKSGVNRHKGPASETAGKVVQQFLEALKKNLEPAKAGGVLGKTTKDDVMSWVDENELDLMHHVIILNRGEAVEYLLKQGYFQAPFVPRSNLYPHLACLLGHRTCLNIILQYRKDDNRPFTKLTYRLDGADATDGTREMTPLDVAAEAGQLACVKQILDQCVIKEHPAFAKYPYVALACLAQSQVAVSFIIKKDKPGLEDIKKAIEVSLKKASADCLDILLQMKFKTDDMFGKRNFFHMLFTFSNAADFGADGYRRLQDVTKVLIRHKYDVNNASPPNTYPMYSLIRNSLCIHDYTNTRHYLSALRMLLEAGANPNFDEVANEKKLNDKGIKSVHDRVAYSSAMNCLFETTEFYSEYLQSNNLASQFVVHVSEVLVHGGVKLETQWKLGDQDCKQIGTVLHQLAMSSVKLGVNTDTFKYFLRQGADPNAKMENGKYVINTFFDTLYKSLKELSLRQTPKDHTNDVTTILSLSLFMTRACVINTLKILKKDYSRNPPHHFKKYYEMADDQLQERVNEVWPLKRICRALIWDLCQRDAVRVKSLPTNIESRTYILPSI
ncbi:uncharacterized protein LOC127852713 [Dreissena polymorpha]|uniref:Uncharacterized protein n=1 Tax=Dreissena polymorpha TaxID=45954 RepID=A0A9D4S4X3_DREPO|nr:uncharacterized protein LOC127852713 [Dreissena polymorpha]XP_052242635.1 uncharacterized protein LOC127852713 [Dreissena polymorpha]KAH3890700.1 hypothetical protein DPMN_014785 [Dreissena polymorpha]